MKEPMETASELYREMKRRGLELRSGNGRDDLLLEQIATKLRCPPTKLQVSLDKSALSAEDFLKVFLKVSAPFARMFQEIWQYLAPRQVSRAAETLSVRFGFPESDDKLELDLESFRRYAEMTKLISATVRLWPPEALHALFEMSRILLRDIGWNTALDRDYGYYRLGEPFQLPEVDIGYHEVDSIVGTIDQLFQSVIDTYAEEARSQKRERELPELDCAVAENASCSSLRQAAQLLTDLLPAWLRIFVLLDRIDRHTKDEALAFYQSKIRQMLGSESRTIAVSVWEALDILDLPFWRHRWHTYEIWATVLTLHNLDEYRPALRVVDGYVPIDGYSAAIIADLVVCGLPSACVAVQVETPFRRLLRTAIKPDLRICFSDELKAEDTAAVVEFKQRKRMSRRYLEEVAHSYSGGSPKAGGVFILNYDDCEPCAGLPSCCRLLDDITPANSDQREAYRIGLIDALRAVEFVPETNVIVLLDVSGSMGSAYKDPAVQDALRLILTLGWVRCFRFNNGLLPGGDLRADQTVGIQTGGGTELGKAVDQIEQLEGLPERLLLVTDGGYGHDSVSRLSKIPEVLECSPEDLPNNLNWLF